MKNWLVLSVLLWLLFFCRKKHFSLMLTAKDKDKQDCEREGGEEKTFKKYLFFCFIPSFGEGEGGWREGRGREGERERGRKKTYKNK